MIAKNYIKHPEALRFQREMFSNGYHNSPRIMRLMEVIFSFAAAVPQWVKDMKKRAADLVKHWKAGQIGLNFKAPAKPTAMIPGFFYGPSGETWSGRGMTPKWLRSLVDMGDQREQYRFNGTH